MKYPCEIIKDLLPLYIDGVCSDESRKAVEEHLAECDECKAFFAEMKQDEITVDEQHEDIKIRSLKNIRKRILQRQLLFAGLAIVLVLSLSIIGAKVLKNQVEVVKPDSNLNVNMIDGSLITRLQSSRISEATSKRVTVSIDGKEFNYLFFYLTNSRWDEMTTGDEVFSEYVLCPKDKSAGDIDAVYYYAGEYESLEDLGNEELKAILETATMLYEK